MLVVPSKVPSSLTIISNKSRLKPIDQPYSAISVVTFGETKPAKLIMRVVFRPKLNESLDVVAYLHYTLPKKVARLIEAPVSL